MDDCRVAVLRARAAAHRSEEARHAVEAARLDAEADAVLAVRAAGVSPWGSELPPPVMQQVLELLQWEPDVCRVMRAVCSTWSSFLDSLLPELRPSRSLAVMQGKLSWYQSVTEVGLTGCENGVCGPLAELASMPSLRSLTLPASCAESAVDAEAVCGLTTLTTLRFFVELDEDDVPVEEVGEWVLDLSRLTTLNVLDLEYCHAVKDKQVLALSHLTGLKDLNLNYCINVSSEGLRAVSSLTALTTLSLTNCPNATSEVLGAVSSLTALTTLYLNYCINVSSEGLHAVSSLTSLTVLELAGCDNVSSEGLRAVSALTGLTALGLNHCPGVTDEGLQTLSTLTALPPSSSPAAPTCRPRASRRCAPLSPT
jgi:hypothetical protein